MRGRIRIDCEANQVLPRIASYLGKLNQPHFAQNSTKSLLFRKRLSNLRLHIAKKRNRQESADSFKFYETRLVRAGLPAIRRPLIAGKLATKRHSVKPGWWNLQPGPAAAMSTDAKLHPEPSLLQRSIIFVGRCLEYRALDHYAVIAIAQPPLSVLNGAL